MRSLAIGLGSFFTTRNTKEHKGSSTLVYPLCFLPCAFVLNLLKAYYNRHHNKSTIQMSIKEQIKTYIASHPEPKRSDMETLHRAIQQIMPAGKLWFLDGKNADNKTVSNPNIGYGTQTIKYADGKTKEFYQIGLSANTTGISVYILGIEDKKHLAQTYGKRIGKASVTGYCIKFKSLKEIDIKVLEEAIKDGIAT